MRNTNRTRRSAGKANANQNGRTASRSTKPSGLKMNFHRAFRARKCRCGACSAATQTRSPYSMVKTTRERISTAVNSGPYSVWKFGTDSRVIATRLIIMSTTMIWPTIRLVRSPIVPCSRISYTRCRRFIAACQLCRSGEISAEEMAMAAAVILACSFDCLLVASPRS